MLGLRSSKIPPPKVVRIERGLTHKEALKRAPWKPSYGDRRGFSYDPKTGVAKWI